MLIRAFTTLGLMVAFAGAANACDLEILDAQSQLSIDAGSAKLEAPVMERYEFRVRNAAGTDCEFRVGLGKDSTSTSAAFPETSLSSSGGAIDLQSLAFASSGAQTNYSFEQTVGANSEVPVSLSFSVKTGWENASGRYNTGLNLFLTDETGTTELVRDEFDLNVDVPASASIRVAGNVKRLDLGPLSTTSPTVSPQFELRVFANDPYEIDVSSENKGHLLREGGQALIPYELTLDGEQINLEGGGEVLTYNEPSGSLGKRLPVVVTVYPDKERLAGRYRDTITVTVTTI